MTLSDDQVDEGCEILANVLRDMRVYDKRGKISTSRGRTPLIRA